MDGIEPEHYRIAIFGSSRLEEGDYWYGQVYDLAKLIAQEGFDIVTGGGPGLMDAASRGHLDGRKNGDQHAVGLGIALPNEQGWSYHLDVKKEFDKFSERLDNFMELSDVIVVAPGGIGTTLELFYTWQLVQVEQMCETLIILLGDRWSGLLDWMDEEIVEKELMDEEDMDFVFNVEGPEEAMDLIREFHEDHQKPGHICKNYEKYR